MSRQQNTDREPEKKLQVTSLSQYLYYSYLYNKKCVVYMFGLFSLISNLKYIVQPRTNISVIPFCFKIVTKNNFNYISVLKAEKKFHQKN